VFDVCVCVCECVARIVHEHNISLILFVFLVVLPVKKLLFSVNIDDFSPLVCVNYSVDSGYTYTTTTAATTQLAAGFLGSVSYVYVDEGFTRPSQSHVILCTWVFVFVYGLFLTCSLCFSAFALILL
jgi:hypothetical protein